MDTTLTYYNNNADDFVENTLNVDFSRTQKLFMDLLPKGAAILDLGCGSGRDTKCFLDNGFDVKATDGSEELCVRASEYTGIKVKCELFQELDDVDRFDGVWACSSILHLDRESLTDVLCRIQRALKDRGIFYTSFKYGDFEGMRNGRYFINFTEESFLSLLSNEQIEGFEVMKMWQTSDVRPGRGEEKWLNMILVKH